MFIFSTLLFNFSCNLCLNYVPLYCGPSCFFASNVTRTLFMLLFSEIHHRFPCRYGCVRRYAQYYHSVLCEIFEKLLKKALLLILTETRPLSPSQHGFLPRRSCLSNLILQEERVTRLLDEGHTVN